MPALLLKFCSGIHELFEELGRHAKRGGSQEYPNHRACKESVKHVLFIIFIETNFLDCLKQALTPVAFEAFHHSSIFNKTVFCLVKNKIHVC